MHVGLDVHAALTRGCRLTKPQINAKCLHFSALVNYVVLVNEII